MNYLLLRKLPEGLWLSNSCWKKWEEFVDFMYTYVLLHTLKHMPWAVKRWIFMSQGWQFSAPPPATTPNCCLTEVSLLRLCVQWSLWECCSSCKWSLSRPVWPGFFTAKSQSRSAGAKREEVARTSCFIWKSVFQSNRLHVSAWSVRISLRLVSSCSYKITENSSRFKWTLIMVISLVDLSCLEFPTSGNVKQQEWLCS